MTTHTVLPGHTLHAHGTLASTGTLVADGGAAGQVGAVINVFGDATNFGTVILEGGQPGGEGAVLNDLGAGVNDGELIVQGGDGGLTPHGVGGTGASVSVSGTGTNNGTVVLEAGNHGTDGGTDGTGATLTVTGALLNAGALQIDGTYSDGSAVAVVEQGGVLTDTGTIHGNGTLENLGLVTGGTAPGSDGTIFNVILQNDGTIVSGAMLEIGSGVNATQGSHGTLEVSSGGTLAVDSVVAADQSIAFLSSAGELDVGLPNAILAPISGFVVGDELNLTGLAYVHGDTSASFANGVLSVTDGAHTDTFNLVGVANGTVFTTQRDAGGEGVLVEESSLCFVQGTRILTARGEVPIEDLRTEDKVITVNGGAEKVKWVGRRAYDGRFIAGNHLMLPVCIKAGALAPDVPRRDLFVSPGHALYIDGVLIPAWRLVNGASIVQASAIDRVSYFHVELENHDVIFAEGAPAETYLDEHARSQFANAAEYAAIYPAESAPGTPCVPRLEDGFALQAIRQRIAARAFLTPVRHKMGALRGYLEVAGPDRLVGWAQDEANPEEPVCLDVFAGSRRVTRILANRFRADVRAAGFGSGCHGFDLALPADAGEITLVRHADGAILPRTGQAAQVKAA